MFVYRSFSISCFLLCACYSETVGIASLNFQVSLCFKEISAWYIWLHWCWHLPFVHEDVMTVRNILTQIFLFTMAQFLSFLCLFFFPSYFPILVQAYCSVAGGITYSLQTIICILFALGVTLAWKSEPLLQFFQLSLSPCDLFVQIFWQIFEYASLCPFLESTRVSKHGYNWTESSFIYFQYFKCV